MTASEIGSQPLPRGAITPIIGGSIRAISDTSRHGVDCSVGELDRALRTGVIKLPGRTLPLAPFLTHGRPAIDQALNALMGHLGTRRDIDRILVVGGGARLFHPALRARFPERPIEVHPDAVFANVKGFQFAGDRILEQVRGTSS